MTEVGFPNSNSLVSAKQSQSCNDRSRSYHRQDRDFPHAKIDRENNRSQDCEDGRYCPHASDLSLLRHLAAVAVEDR